jgi:hypothetical protein
MAVTNQYGLFRLPDEQILARIIAAFERTKLQPTKSVWVVAPIVSYDGHKMTRAPACACGVGALGVDLGVDTDGFQRHPDLGIGGHEVCLAAGWDHELVFMNDGSPRGCDGCGRRHDRCRWWTVGRAAALAMGLE